VFCPASVLRFPPSTCGLFHGNRNACWQKQTAKLTFLRVAEICVNHSAILTLHEGTVAYWYGPPGRYLQTQTHCCHISIVIASALCFCSSTPPLLQFFLFITHNGWLHTVIYSLAATSCCSKCMHIIAHKQLPQVVFCRF
jgi:hypothetical protein